MEVCCTICGCNDVEVLSEPSTIAPLPTAAVQGAHWPVPGRGKCNHCHGTFQFTNEPERTRPLQFEVYCPICKSPDTRVTKSPAAKDGYKIRDLECNNCKHDFQTIDRVAPTPDIHTR